MDPNASILELSSDEDVGCGEREKIVDGDDHNWLSLILDEVNKDVVDGGKYNVDIDDDDDDDVVVIGEKPADCGGRGRRRLRKLDDLEGERRLMMDDDDECVILDGDPDKAVAVREVEEDNAGGGDDEEELVVISEKGAVACRDYPHARHLCVKFPFSSTSHESYCEQCHCYVCDSLAPCLYWVTGTYSSDHCHATEKDDFWKQMRTSQKNVGGKLFPPVPKIVDTSLLTRLPYTMPSPAPLVMPQNQVPMPTHTNQVSPSPPDPLVTPQTLVPRPVHTNVVLPSSAPLVRPQNQVQRPAHMNPIPPNPTPLVTPQNHVLRPTLASRVLPSPAPLVRAQNQIPRSTRIRSSPLSAKSRLSSVRDQRSVPRTNFPSKLTSQQLLLLRECSSTNSRDRSNGSTAPQLLQEGLRRRGSAAIAQDSSGSFKRGRSHVNSSNTTFSGTPSNINSSRMQYSNLGMIRESHAQFPSSQTHMNNPLNSVPSQANVSEQNTGTSLEKTPVSQIQITPQANKDTLFEIPIFLQPDLPSQPNYQSNSQPPISSRPNYQSNSQPQISSQSNYQSNSQPQIFSQPNYQSNSQSQISSQPNYQPNSQPQISSQPNYQSNSQPQISSQPNTAVSTQPLVSYHEGSQINSALDSTFLDFDRWLTTCSENIQEPTTGNAHLESVDPTNDSSLVAGSGLLDLKFNDWIFDNQPVEPGFIEPFTPFGLNEGSSELPLITDGSLFNINRP